VTEKLVVVEVFAFWVIFWSLEVEVFALWSLEVEVFAFWVIFWSLEVESRMPPLYYYYYFDHSSNLN
jgi:hypothetical protein